MESKIREIELMWLKRRQGIQNSSMMIVDANGNSLFESLCDERTGIREEDNVLRERDHVTNDTKLLLNQKMIWITETDDEKNENRLSKDDIAMISNLLQKNKSQGFTMILNKTNYIGFVNSGLLICRGKFNTRKDGTVYTVNSTEKPVSHVRKFHNDLSMAFPLLVACKVSEMLIIVTGISSSDESVVYIAKCIADLLKETSY